MSVSTVKFADHNIRGVAIEPKCKAHYGVVEFVANNMASVLSVNAGQVIFITSSSLDYCIGFADGSNSGTGIVSPLLRIGDRFISLDETECAQIYAEWLDNQRADITGQYINKTKWGI